MIFRKDIKNSFTVIPNNIVTDDRLSLKAKGILLYMLSKPNDWQFYETEIVTKSKDGLSAVKAGIKELEKVGYVVRKRIRDSKGRLKGTEYIIHDTAPICDFPTLDNPTLENQTLLITDYNNINKTNINGIFIKAENSVCKFSFNEFISIFEYYAKKYMAHTGKEHPVYTTNKWLEVLKKIDMIYDEYGTTIDLEYNDYFVMIDRYFNTKLDCDYRFAHFMSGNIRLKSWLEKLY